MTKRTNPLWDTPHPSLPQSGEGAFCHPEQLEHHHPELDSGAHNLTNCTGLNRVLHKQKKDLVRGQGWLFWLCYSIMSV